ncbi:COMM domain containing 10 protein valette [Arctopsyche grandis]|uniref:COMM domain containing 10 protein valette n=1 Tax=Arctopsyche grandis TaxID=121162 RepID=UPI00406D96A2
MDFPWINITPELENGIKIINQLDGAKFQKFLAHIQVNSATRTKNEIFSSDEATALERVFKLENVEVTLVIKVTLYILERMSKFVMRPVCILNDLSSIMKMNEDKAENFINVWRDLMKIIAEEYNFTNLGEIEQLSDPTWQLNLALCSHLNKKEKQTSILLDMKTVQNSSKPNEKCFVELTTDELVCFNNQLEAVQLELDAIIRSHV